MMSAEISARCCSKPLQRAITDFGADHAFGQVPNKLHEHYGIKMSVSTIRQITEFHAQQMYAQQETREIDDKIKGCKQQIGQIDGCMLPIMTPNKEVEDKRKQKTLQWKEARLALVHEQGSIVPKFGAIFNGSVDDAGQVLLNCAVDAGFGSQTNFHGVGDGAFWIAKQVEKKFGRQSSYLADFYHVCEYLADAAKVCVPLAPEKWIENQKKLLKSNDYQIVIENLESHLETTEIENNKAPVRACHRYLCNRTEQLDYKGAIEKDLPIGSGEIESAHRYVIQKRLKLPGAWWKIENVDPMLSLRIVRANNDWNSYWGDSYEAT